MYHSCTDPVVKERISNVITKNSHIRVLVATVVNLGLGWALTGLMSGRLFTLDHLMTSSEEFLVAILIPKESRYSMDKRMRDYVNNIDTCRHVVS